MFICFEKPNALLPAQRNLEIIRLLLRYTFFMEIQNVLGFEVRMPEKSQQKKFSDEKKAGGVEGVVLNKKTGGRWDTSDRVL